MQSKETLLEINRHLETALAAGQLVALATLIDGPGPVGSKALLFPDGRRLGSLGSEGIDEATARDAARMMASLRGQLARSFDYEMQEAAGAPARVFIELFPPPPHLVIFGGVHIAIPLTRLAKMLGFRVTLADPRTTFANETRFPEVDEIIPEWPDEAVERLAIGPSTYCVILTHDPKIDEPALKAVLGRGAAYVGAIGSRKTHAERFERMARHGVSAEQLQDVYAPIGLDLNGETPEEIALSIMAEIVAVRRGGRAGFMKEGR